MNIEIKETKECEYCNKERDIYKGIFYLTDISITIKSHRNMIANKDVPCLYILGKQITSDHLKGITSSYIPIKYCPICGRKL